MHKPAYADWADKGVLEVTQGETTDYDRIEEWLRGIASQFDLRACAYDPYVLMQLSQQLRNEGFSMFEYRATVLNFSESTKMLDALMREGRIVQDGSAVARWCIGDVVGHYDRRGNVYAQPAPESRARSTVPSPTSWPWAPPSPMPVNPNTSMPAPRS